MPTSSKEILQELEKCSNDPIYFIRRYVNIEHPIKGIIPFDLYRFQEKIIRNVKDERFNIVRKFRQGGITTLSAAYSLWSIIFKKNHHVMVVSIGDRESTAFLRRVVLMYDDLPKWLKPKLKEKNKHTLHLSTDSRIRSQPAGAGRGESVSHLIVDEAAFIDNMREFWAAIYPTISTGGKATLISTVNGMSNLYYELYRDAQLEKNGFKIIDLNWREHPDYTEEWAEVNRPIIGERMWLQEYECEFLGTGDTFIDRHTLRRLRDNQSPEYHTKHTGYMRVWEEPDSYASYVIGVDSSYGRDRDNSAFHIMNLYNGEQVAEFCSNKTSISDFANIINIEGNNYNTASVVVERNGLGIALLQELFEVQEYENLWMDENAELGVQVTQKTREIILASLEEHLRSSKIRINSERSVDELLTFIITENGKIEADEGYTDDLVMSLAMATFTMEDLRINTPMVPTKIDEEGKAIKDPGIAPLRVSNNDSDALSEYQKWLMKD